jgi:hypothetical protein
MDKSDREQHKKAIFWSYSEIPRDKNTLIEHTLKYADVAEIKKIIAEFGVETCIEVWHKTLLPDVKFRKLNFFLAKFIFNISTEDADIELYFTKYSKTRGNRIYEIFNR